MSNPWPRYDASNGIHTMGWKDGSRLVYDHPHLDKKDYVAFGHAYSANGTLVAEEPFRIFNSTDIVRFALRCAALNGTTPIDWHVRMGLMGAAVRATLLTQAAATPPTPLRRPITPPEPYPVDDLGPILAPMVRALMACVQAPDAICSQSVLAAATLAVQGHADICIDGRQSPISSYFIDIGESGERRSAVDRLALYPHTKQERKLYDAYTTAKPAYDNELESWRKAREQALKEKKDTDRQVALEMLGSQPPQPLDPLFLVEEPTYEGLVKLFVTGQPSLGLFSDEGGRFLGGHGMNTDNLQKTIGGLCEFWDGKRTSRVRAGEAPLILYGRRLAMHLMVQPVIAEPLLSHKLLLGQGFLNRCLVCWPTSTVGARFYKDVDLTTDPHVQAYNDRIATCLHATLRMANGSPNELDPRAITLTREAKKRWVLFHDHIEGQLGDDQPLHAVRGFGNKAAEHAARLASVLALIDDLHTTEIQKPYMEAAIHLVNFYVREAKRLFYVAATDPDLVLGEQLLGFLAGKPSISLPDVYQRGPDGLRDAKTARRIMTTLEDHGWLVRIPGGSEVNGTYRKEAWEVRP
jgi:hypothetical protein